MAAASGAFDALCDLINVATPDSVRERLPVIFTPKNLAREPLARRIGAFMDWRKRGGFEPVRVESEMPNTLEVEIRFPVSQDNWRVRLMLDEGGSGLIDEMLMGRAHLTPHDGNRSDRDIAEEFLSYITHLGQHDLFSGAVMIGRHGRKLGACATGFASHEHGVLNTKDTLFNVASLTKSWTAVAIMRLVEDGALHLETPIVDILNLDGVSLDSSIRIKHLLSHTSGLGDYFGKDFNVLSKDRIRTLDDFLGLATTFEPAFAPGTDWSYSNIGMMLLGKTVEKITCEAYHRALKSLVFEPAGMTSAFFPHLDEVNLGCASGYGYRWTDTGPVRINALHSWAVRGAADGCAFASLADIWAFAQAFADGKLVSQGTVLEMTSPKPELGSRDYGYGFALLPDRAVVGHSGGLIGASANLDIMQVPDGWVVIVLANDLSMRTPVIKARQMIGVSAQERDDAQTNMPRAGLTAR